MLSASAKLLDGSHKLSRLALAWLGLPWNRVQLRLLFNIEFFTRVTVD